ncbi:DUF6126 family protein [Streptomyces sp. enrichment culture]|uniref:DUF6126 family protein n=1 Tax=Streptomyces sp. enrichment culture TaxID=1795815 RepID=UPI003F555D5C
MSHETGAARTDAEPCQPRQKGNKRDEERGIERGVALRAGFYIFGTHLFAGFVWLLFYLGEHAHK